MINLIDTIYHVSISWNSTGPTPTRTPTLGMRLSCNFVNVYTIAYRVRYTFTRVHARIPNGHPREDPREEKRACRTSRRTSRRGCPCRCPCRSHGILAIGINFLILSVSFIPASLFLTHLVTSSVSVDSPPLYAPPITPSTRARLAYIHLCVPILPL